jgi:hypothetical protein
VVSIAIAFAAFLLAACGSTQLPELVDQGDRQAAEKVLQRAVDTHGGRETWKTIDDVVVRYEGEWASIGPRIQPILADTSYRRSSVEVVLPAKRIVGQLHEGPQGTKAVYRTPESIEVSYDGEPATDEKVLDAAALVADAYQLFLTAPFFLDAFATTVRWAGTETVDGELCDQISAVVRPGFGRVDEDLALLSVGRDSGIVRRVRFTLNGLESTQGAEVDVTFRGHREIDGILWATEYVERIRAPFKLDAHEWRLVSLETNTGRDPLPD